MQKQIKVIMKKQMQNKQRMVVVKKTRTVRKYVYKPKTY